MPGLERLFEPEFSILCDIYGNLSGAAATEIASRLGIAPFIAEWYFSRLESQGRIRPVDAEGRAVYVVTDSGRTEVADFLRESKVNARKYMKSGDA